MIEPVRIELDGVGKRFGRRWIVRGLSGTLESGEIVGVRGRNGSGKSTLLRMLSGQLGPSEGTIAYLLAGQPVGTEQVYRHVSWTGPYFEVAEELTVRQFIDFHFRFKPWLTGGRDPGRWGVAAFANRKLLDCSSGMRQRVLLGCALFSATPILLLDEPTVTLDEVATDWFQEQLRFAAVDRLTVIASNDPRDLEQADRILER